MRDLFVFWTIRYTDGWKCQEIVIITTIITTRYFISLYILFSSSVCMRVHKRFLMRSAVPKHWEFCAGIHHNKRRNKLLFEGEEKIFSVEIKRDTQSKIFEKVHILGIFIYEHAWKIVYIGLVKRDGCFTPYSLGA